ncbi:hypothetical protein TSUD_13460 [Trifolium subterraneum]|uniref:Disease resistance protein At4g27190-like leucine-rich repeats domain-containing protein n=1 Tax=Trifolium subterraneum TaxID=3900 RepID=A0A2Z6PGY7_TRISU|nr:hypothetical protein TSUD_13460 [Trifolium subterraneum]
MTETMKDINTAVDRSKKEPEKYMDKSIKLPASTASSVKKKKSISNYKGCKVLLISESKRVLSSQMEGKVESIYFVDVLKEKETEASFKKMAGIGDRNTEFEKLATQIASKCYGLPISIVATGRALQNQSRSVWEDVHRQLERGKLTGAYEFSTRLSYDLLENEELKFAFLLCARMGPDALVMDLVRYSIDNSNIRSLIKPKERSHPEKVIKINLCGKLQTVFLASLVSHLTLLETIEVSKCDGLKEIVEVERQSNTNDIEVNFPELRSLVLHSLSDKFIGFYPISSTEEEPRSLFNEKVVVSKLQRLELSSIQVDEIWSDQPSQMSCFRNLIHLDVNGCGNLKYLISFSMAKSLINLQSLFISECQKMTTIFPKGKETLANTKDNIFSKLKNIQLRNMKNLREIWNSELPSNSCHKLNSLIIEECDKLVNVIPCYMEGIFQSLCNLRVTNCKSMKAVFELDARKGKDGDVTNLQDVYLETLPKLEQVLKWNKDQIGILKLNSLQKMRVHDCESLESIFPVSIATCLDNLEYLVIRDCFGLREIVAKGDGSYTDKNNPDPSFEFPKLTTIKLSKLPRLACFYPGDYELSCPVLNDLSIELCDRLEPFRKELTNAQKMPTFFSGKVINKLKSMHIESRHAQSSSSYIGEGNH